jgi:hypothetical protein
MPQRVLGWAVFLLLCACALPGRGETVTLTPQADTTLFEVSPNNSAGGAGFFNSGTTQNETRNRALLRFDIGEAVPAGAQITGVGLQVEVTRVPGDGFEPSVFGLHYMLRSWGEGEEIPMDNPGGLGAPAMPGDATWLHAFAFDTPWAMPGGASGIDYRETFSSSTLIYGVDVYNFEGTLDMIADVQSWLDNPNANHGWMLISQAEDVPFTARRFASSEDPNGGGPQLFIEYTLIPEPGTWALLAMGAVCLVPAIRRKLAR